MTDDDRREGGRKKFYAEDHQKRKRPTIEPNDASIRNETRRKKINAEVQKEK